MAKGISREMIRYVGFLLVFIFFLAMIFVFFNEEVATEVSKLMDVISVGK